MQSHDVWPLPVLGIAFLVITALGWVAALPHHVAAALELVVAFLTSLHQLVLREPDRLSAKRHAMLAAVDSFVITWSFSAAVAFVVVSLGFGAPVAEAAKHQPGFFALLMITAPNVGGVLALLRSVRTRSETGALLRELSASRVATLSTPMIEESVRVHEARDLETLARGVRRMLHLAVSLPLTRDLLDKAALWCRDDERKQWVIVASSDATGRDLGFTMPFLSVPTPAGGITANLAIAAPPRVAGCFHERDVFLCTDHLQEHPWFMGNDRSAGATARGMAAVVLRDEAGNVLGTLSLTTREGRILPVDGAQRRELVDILRFWSHSFLGAVRTLLAFRLREAKASALAGDSPSR